MDYIMVIDRGYIKGLGEIKDGRLVWGSWWVGEQGVGQLVPSGYQIKTDAPAKVATIYRAAKISPTRRKWMPKGWRFLCEAGIGYSDWGGNRIAPTGDVYYQLPDGRIVIGHHPHRWYFESLDDYQAEEMPKADPGTVRFGVWDSVTDDIRELVSRLVGPLPTQAEQQAGSDARFQRILADIEAERVAREGGQLLDGTPVAHEPDVPTVEQCQQTIEHEGKTKHFIRLKATGFTAVTDMESNPIEEVIEKQGGRFHYQAAAISGAAIFAGTISGGGVRELCYTISGLKRWMYVVLHDGGDSWCQECWTTNHRLNADAAVDTIKAARALAYKRR